MTESEQRLLYAYEAENEELKEQVRRANCRASMFERENEQLWTLLTIMYSNRSSDHHEQPDDLDSQK